MSAALAIVAPRIGQLVRLLGSDRDGEVLAAARALGRALKSVDADFHTLAHIIETSAPADNHGSADARAMAAWLIRSGARLSEKERTFICQMATWRGEPSEKQTSWLLSIFERVSAGGAP